MKNLLISFFLSLILLFSSVESSTADTFEVGHSAYLDGDYQTALRIWTNLAEKGDAEAQLFLGLMYANGTGIPQFYKEAEKWYLLAAEQGNADAQALLGYIYWAGTGVEKDEKKALKFWMLAAEQGNVDAQRMAGFMYWMSHINGIGTAKDIIYAHMWINIARTNGDEESKQLALSLEREMTPSQIEKAQILARECVAKDYKGC